VSAGISKIIVGTDLSEEAEVAVRHGLAISRRYGAELTLVHVGDVPQKFDVPPALASVATDYAEAVKQQFSAARKRLEDERERFAGQGADVSQAFVDGVPAEALAKTAEELGADLLIVGSRGQSAFRRFLLGSTAEAVVRRSRGTVLVARGDAPSDGAYQNILCPVDDSERTSSCLQAARALCAPGGRVVLFHSWSLPGTGGLIAALSDEWTQLRKALEDSVVQRGHEMVEKYQAPEWQLSFSHRQGQPSKAIQEALEGGDFDLVVMGSHGRHGVARWALGSVAEMTVRHSDCSVAVVHTGAEKE